MTRDRASRSLAYGEESGMQELDDLRKRGAVARQGLLDAVNRLRRGEATVADVKAATSRVNAVTREMRAAEKRLKAAVQAP